MARRGYGDAAIRADLQRRRISAETIAAAIEELEPEAERARRVVEGKERTPALLRRLASRGFSRDTLEDLADAIRSAVAARLPCRAMRRYHVTTFGCQMNAHDSERIKGALEELGLGETTDPDEADVLVFNTCTIREKPDQRFAAHMGNAARRKRERPDTVVAVGGCYAEAQTRAHLRPLPARRRRLRPRHDLPPPRLARRRRRRRRARQLRHGRRARSSQPVSRCGASGASRRGCRSRWAATRSAPTASFPPCAGEEISRRPGEILAEIEQLAREGVREVTLLGQNVNSYGRDVGSGFAELLRAVDAVDGIDRIRFTSPHPKDFRRDVIEAMAECAAVCEHAHLPLQSGSTRILKAMRRTYSRERYLKLVAELRDAIPDLALTTDIIVGFPGETDARLRARPSRSSRKSASTARSRSSTRRARAPRRPRCPTRFRMRSSASASSASSTSSSACAAERNRARVGSVEEVLVEGRSRTEPDLLRGRTRRNTTVNFAGEAEPGQLVDVRIESATSTTLAGAQLALAVA